MPTFPQVHSGCLSFTCTHLCACVPVCVCVFKEHTMSVRGSLVQEACSCLSCPVLACILQTWAQTWGFYVHQGWLRGLATRAFSWGSTSWPSGLEVLSFLFEFVFCKWSLARQWSCVPGLEALVWVTASLGWVLVCSPLLTPPLVGPQRPALFLCAHNGCCL